MDTRSWGRGGGVAIAGHLRGRPGLGGHSGRCSSLELSREIPVIAPFLQGRIRGTQCRREHPETLPLVLWLGERRPSGHPFWKGALGGSISKRTQADLGRHPIATHRSKLSSQVTWYKVGSEGREPGGACLTFWGHSPQTLQGP